MTIHAKFFSKIFLTIWGILSEYNMFNPPPSHPLPSILRFWNYLFIEKSTNFSSCCYRLPLLTMKITNINSKLYQFINLLTVAGKITDPFSSNFLQVKWKITVLIHSNITRVWSIFWSTRQGVLRINNLLVYDSQMSRF